MDITPLDVQYEDVQEAGAVVPDVVVTGNSPLAPGPPLLGRDSPDRGVVPVDTDLPVLCAGYLQKQGRRFRGWHQRWFEIQGQHMYYYKTNAKSQCLGEIELSICTQVQPTSAATFGVSFEVQTTERSHILAARKTDDVEKWIQCIKSNMGPREGTKPTKTTKMKKWDSFRNAFSIQPRKSSQASPEPAEPRKKADVSRNKSFFDRFRRNRSKSPAPANRKNSDVPGGEVRVGLRHSERGQSSRPLSARSEDVPASHLYPPDVPVTVSLPTTPLTAKKDYETTENITHSPSSSLKTPESNVSSAPSSPEHSPKFDSSPVHTSTPAPKQESSPGSKKDAVGKSSPPKPKPPPRIKRSTSKMKQQTSTSSILPDILEEKLAWDEIKEMLESLPERVEQLSYDELPSEDETWLEKDSPIEQLREFLAVCA